MPLQAAPSGEEGHLLRDRGRGLREGRLPGAVQRLRGLCLLLDRQLAWSSNMPALQRMRQLGTGVRHRWRSLRLALERELPGGESGALLEDNDAEAVPDPDREHIASLYALCRPLQPRRLSRLPGQRLPSVEPRGHLRGENGRAIHCEAAGMVRDLQALRVCENHWRSCERNSAGPEPKPGVRVESSYPQQPEAGQPQSGSEPWPADDPVSAGVFKSNGDEAREVHINSSRRAGLRFRSQRVFLGAAGSSKRDRNPDRSAELPFGHDNDSLLVLCRFGYLRRSEDGAGVQSHKMQSLREPGGQRMVLQRRVGASSRALLEDGAPRDKNGQGLRQSRVPSVSEVRPRSAGRHIQRCQLQLLGCSACRYTKSRRAEGDKDQGKQVTKFCGHCSPAQPAARRASGSIG
ncbi:unnamed protein product [Symbiodinium sp. CCMP2456]|nr:unnamed protein product [Symbiodinium sp. CCMP2456]